MSPQDTDLIKPTLSARAQAAILATAVVLTAGSAVLTKRVAPLNAAPPLASLSSATEAPSQPVSLPETTGAPSIVNVATQPFQSTAQASATAQPQSITSLRIDNPDPADIITPDSGAPRYYDGRPLRVKEVIWMEVTAYSPDERSCGKWADGITASNKSVWTNGMRLVAADTSILPFGSLVSMPTYAGGETVPVLDRGGAIKGNRLDVLYATHERALVFGRQRIPVTVWEYADES